MRGKTRIGRISHRKDDPNNRDNQIDVRLPPGSGTWTVRLTTEEILGVPFHAWIEQNDRGLGRFVNGSTPYFTLGSICCGESPVTVGAYDTFESTYLARPHEETSAGPTRDKKQKPDVSAPGVGIVAAKALTEGETFKMSGTSVAAPHVSGLVALLFQLARKTGRTLKAHQVRELLRETARREPGKDWDERLGAGRIDGVAALQALEKLEEERPVTREQEEPILAAAGSQDIYSTEPLPEPESDRMARMEKKLNQLSKDLEEIKSLLRSIPKNGSTGSGSHDPKPRKTEDQPEA